MTTGCQIKPNLLQENIVPIQTKIYSGSTEICPWVKMIYDEGYYGNEIQYCTSLSWEYHLMVERYGVEWWSGRNFFDLQGNELWKIEQYAEWDWTLPRFPWSSWKTFDWSCKMIDLKSCNIIDLVSSYWSRNWLLTGSAYGKICKEALKKMKLRPTELWIDPYELWMKYMMCTNDSDIFYIWFTGAKIGNNKSALYQNYNTIQFYDLAWDELGYTTKFKLKTNGDILESINILGNDSDKSTYSIHRCIYMPIDDCYERVKDKFSLISELNEDY